MKYEYIRLIEQNKQLKKMLISTLRTSKGINERLLYELANKKKRIDGIARFCHGALDFIIIETEQVQGPAMKYVLRSE